MFARTFAILALAAAVSAFSPTTVPPVYDPTTTTVSYTTPSYNEYTTIKVYTTPKVVVDPYTTPKVDTYTTPKVDTYTTPKVDTYTTPKVDTYTTPKIVVDPYYPPTDKYKKCYENGERCVGAYNHPYVEYMPCCDKDADVAEKYGDWGKFCIKKSTPVIYKEGERCVGTEGHEYIPNAPCEDSCKCITTGYDWGKFCVKKEKVGYHETYGEYYIPAYDSYVKVHGHGGSVTVAGPNAAAASSASAAAAASGPKSKAVAGSSSAAAVSGSGAAAAGGSAAAASS
jgi:hypothetical protein